MTDQRIQRVVLWTLAASVASLTVLVIVLAARRFQQPEPPDSSGELVELRERIDRLTDRIAALESQPDADPGGPPAETWGEVKAAWDELPPSRRHFEAVIDVFPSSRGGLNVHKLHVFLGPGSKFGTVRTDWRR